MFSGKSTEHYENALDGIKRKTLVFGKNTLMTEFLLSENSLIPMHNHPHEQTGYLVSGRIRLMIGDDVFTCNPGDSWCIPENIEHGVQIMKDSVTIEIFSPVREDYLPS